MMPSLLMMVLIPVAAALLAWVIGRLRNELTFIGAVLPLYYAVRLFIRSRHEVVSYQLLEAAGIPVALRVDALSGFVILFVAIFGVLVAAYSLRYMRGKEGLRGYYFYLLMALACANGVLLSANLVVLLFFWGCMLAVLYGLLLVGHGERAKVATKALVIVGLSDFSMLLGIAVLLAHNGWVNVAPPVPLALKDPVLIMAFLLVTAGALAKAGSMPLHTWIPAASETAPPTTMALIPASLDKLLGIYLMTRLAVYMFDIGSSVVLRNVLMTVGAVTVLGAVMMALVQKRVMKLLAFHSVSQVGYMIMGIGTGVPIGIAGGLFHMLNNSIYKTGLFLSAGSVEHWSKTDEIDRLGGLAGKMPLTFLSFLVCALAISGIPPLNGFASKWMVYQGVIELAQEGHRIYPLFLIAAMLGSVLTMASFLKLLHSIFFGQRPAALEKTREVSATMWLPTVLLALTCVVFGVFAYQIPLRGLIYPSLPFAVDTPGVWQPLLMTILILISLGVGAVIYLAGTARRPVPGRTFVGGEKIAEEEEGRVTGTAFYSPVKHLPILDELLVYGEKGAFDLYNWVTGVFRALSAVFRAIVDGVLEAVMRFVKELVWFGGVLLTRLHTGNLPLYVGWVFIGAVVFYLVLFLR